MPPRTAAAEALRDLSRVLKRWGGDWYVFGAQAVIAYGTPRLTADIDVTVLLRPFDPAAFVKDMNAAGFRLRVSDSEEFVRQSRVLPFVHEKTDLPFDIVFGSEGIESEFSKRSKTLDIGGFRAPVISPEDLVITKILAGRDKDVSDARGVRKKLGRSLDLRRVRRILRELEEALGQSDLISTLDAIVEQD